MWILYIYILTFSMLEHPVSPFFLLSPFSFSVSWTNKTWSEQVVKVRMKTQVRMLLCECVCAVTVCESFCVSWGETNRTDLGHSAISSKAARKLKPGQPLIHWGTFPYVAGCPALIKLSDLLHILLLIHIHPRCSCGCGRDRLLWGHTQHTRGKFKATRYA